MQMGVGLRGRGCGSCGWCLWVGNLRVVPALENGEECWYTEDVVAKLPEWYGLLNKRTLSCLIIFYGRTTF
jgi:hypothetical protein